MEGNDTGFDGTNLPTSDNRYLSNMSFSVNRAAWLFDISTRRIRQIAHSYNIGVFEENRWRFSWEDLIMLDTHIKKGKRRAKVSRDDLVVNFVHGADVAPKTFDELLTFVSRQFPQMRRQFMDLVQAALTASHNEHVKDFKRHEKLIYNSEMEIRELWAAVKEINPNAVKPLGRHGNGNRGRGASDLAVLARLTLNTGRTPRREAA